MEYNPDKTEIKQYLDHYKDKQVTDNDSEYEDESNSEVQDKES